MLANCYKIVEILWLFMPLFPLSKQIFASLQTGCLVGFGRAETVFEVTIMMIDQYAVFFFILL